MQVTAPTATSQSVESAATLASSSIIPAAQTTLVGSLKFLASRDLFTPPEPSPSSQDRVSRPQAFNRLPSRSLASSNPSNLLSRTLEFSLPSPQAAVSKLPSSSLLWLNPLLLPPLPQPQLPQLPPHLPLQPLQPPAMLVALSPDVVLVATSPSDTPQMEKIWRR